MRAVALERIDQPRDAGGIARRTASRVQARADLGRLLHARRLRAHRRTNSSRTAPSEITIDGRYLYGAPAAKLELEGEVMCPVCHTLLSNSQSAEANRIRPGFDPDRLAVLGFNLKMNGYSPEQATTFQRRLADRLRTVPGATP